MTGDGVPRVTKLDIHNYLQWSVEIEHIMRFKGCWEAVAPIGALDGTVDVSAVSGAAPLTAAADAAAGVGATPALGAGGAGMTPTLDAIAANAIYRKEQQAMSLMVLNVKTHHLPTFRTNATARGAWQALEAEFRSRGPARAVNLRRDLNSLVMTGGEAVVQYFNRAKGIVWELSVLGIAIDDAQLLSSLLAGLSEKFTLTVSILSVQRDMSVSHALEELLAAESRMALDKCKNKRPTDNLALAAGSEDGPSADYKKTNRKERLCFKCNKPGHYKRDCKQNGKNAAAGISMIATATVAVRKAGNALKAAVTPWGINVKTHWVVDSGASQHMTGEQGNLVNVEDCDPVTVTIADGSTQTATQKGTAELLIKSANKRWSLTLQDVLVVPGMAVSLFSVRKAAEVGYITEFHTKAVRVRKNDQTVLEGGSVGPVYVLHAVPTEALAAAANAHPAVDAATWHRRLVHMSPGVMARTAKMVTGMPVDHKEVQKLGEAVCPPCITGKMTRAPFATSTSATSAPLQLVHTDVRGPMPVESPAGSNYEVCIIDDYSRFKALVPIKTKGEAKSVLMDVLNLWENKLGLRTGTIRSDGGKEYTGKDFSKWLSAKGIEHQTSTRYTPQQNGVAERYNRTVGEHVCAILAETGLDNKWWAEAGETVNYVCNRTPQRNQSKTPFELFYGTVPDLGHLRAFGCRAWVYMPKDIRRKMDPRAVEGTFLGYASNQKGYRVAVQDKIVVSRDVRFDESDVGGRPTTGRHASGPTLADVEIDVDDAPQGQAGDATETGDEPGPIDDAIAAAQRLVADMRGEEDGNVEDDADAHESDADSNDDNATAAANAAGDDVGEDEEAAEPPSRSSARSLRANPKSTKRADANVVWALAAKAGSNPDKMTIHKAKLEHDWPAFDEAVKKEVDSLWEKKTWVLTDLPLGKKVTDTQMLCERKRGADGHILKRKGRYVGRGDKQQFMVDYCETWAPVARHSTLRAFLARCAADGLYMCQMDVETAFLNGEVEEEIYVRQPVGYERGDKTKVCRLLKALYGLKQASRVWHKKLQSVLLAGGFRPANADPCLFIGTVDGVVCYLLVYVDDIIAASKSAAAVDAAKAGILKAFKARDMGSPSYFLGMHITRDSKKGVLQLGQRQYVVSLLERFGLTEANPVRLPMGAGVRLQKEGDLLPDDAKAVYQEMLGALLYLATCTRPDITFAVGRLSRYAAAPTTAHLAAAKTVLRYLKGTTALALEYGKDAHLQGYSDADFAADVDSRRSTTGYLFLRNGAAISWLSKIQPTVAASTTEAEYVAASMAAKEAVWLQRLDKELGGTGAAVPLKCDNQGAIAMMRNPTSSARTKHIDVCHHFIREKVEEGRIKVDHVGTAEMMADSLTKPLATVAFGTCRSGMGLRPMA